MTGIKVPNITRNIDVWLLVMVDANKPMPVANIENEKDASVSVKKTTFNGYIKELTTESGT